MILSKEAQALMEMYNATLIADAEVKSAMYNVLMAQEVLREAIAKRTLAENMLQRCEIAHQRGLFRL